MPDEMGNYQNLQDIGSITKVETVGEEALQQAQQPQQRLPPGFRFHPTDEELVSYYLMNKVQNNSSHYFQAIDEVNLNRCEPWDLPPKTKVGENQWYFFSHRDRKYPTGLRTNRATDAGYWKATGKDREVMSSNKVIGMKKTLVFYLGRAPKGEKTNWIMHEYRIEGASSPVTEWVVCRVFKKNVASAAAAACKKSNSSAAHDQEAHDYHHHHQGASSSSYQQDLEDSEIQSSTYLPPLMDSPNHHQSGGHTLTSAGGHYYTTSSSSPHSAVEYQHPQQLQLQQSTQGAGVNFACADIYLQNAIRGHELAELQNSSRSFNVSSHLSTSSSFNPNWAIRREMQGLANAESTVDSMVSGFLHDHWSEPVGSMPSNSTHDSVWN